MAHKPTMLVSFMSCIAYSLMSNCMVLTNRYLVGSAYYGFKEKTIVILAQSIIAVLLLEFAKARKLISYESYSKETAKAWAPVTIFFVLMLYTSTQATAGLPIHICTVFKNMTNIVIVIGEWKIFQQKVGALVIASLLVMLLGAVMASFSDASDSKESTLSGYIWMVLNCMCTATYLLYMRYATSTASIRISKFGMAFYNNLIAIPLVLPATVLNGELFSSYSNPLWSNYSFLFLFVMSGVMGVLLNLSTFWCVSVTTATTYATVGALNKLPTTFIGVLLLHEPLKANTALFVTFGMFGGILYGYAKFKEQQAEKRKVDLKTAAEHETETLVGSKV